jgi:hypothetical protein
MPGEALGAREKPRDSKTPVEDEKPDSDII